MFQFAIVTNYHEVHLCSPRSAHSMYEFIRWLVRLGRCENFTVYICRMQSDSCLYEYEFDMFDECFTDYPSFSVAVADGVEKMTEEFYRKISGI